MGRVEFRRPCPPLQAPGPPLQAQKNTLRGYCTFTVHRPMYRGRGAGGKGPSLSSVPLPLGSCPPPIVNGGKEGRVGQDYVSSKLTRVRQVTRGRTPGGHRRYNVRRPKGAIRLGGGGGTSSPIENSVAQRPWRRGTGRPRPCALCTVHCVLCAVPCRALCVVLYAYWCCARYAVHCPALCVVSCARAPCVVHCAIRASGCGCALCVVPCAVLCAAVRCVAWVVPCAACCALCAMLFDACAPAPACPTHPRCPVERGGGRVAMGAGLTALCASSAAEMRLKTSCSPRATPRHGGRHLVPQGAAGSLCAHVGTRAPRCGQARALAGPAVAAPAYGPTVRASLAPAALRTPVWPAPAMPREHLLPPSEPLVPVLAGPGLVTARGGAYPGALVSLVRRAAASADSLARLQAAAARKQAMLRTPGAHRPPALHRRCSSARATPGACSRRDRRA